MSSAVSPLAPTNVPDMPEIAGVRLATAEAGIRYKNRTDVLLALFDEGTTVAGVFTKSRCPSAPVEWCRANLKSGKSKRPLARALVVNSGNANAFTGKNGRSATKLTADITSKVAGCKINEIFLASTGVIGEPLDASKFAPVMASLNARARAGDFAAAAKAIMTTDTFPKVATATAKIGKAKVTINGIAKGAGMIAPDMATMLSFVFTDAAISAPALQALLKDGVADTFNAVTIDGDTSTSDTLMMFATGKAKDCPRIARANDPRLKAYKKALQSVLADLSEQVARDGEGARKLVEIVVEGAASKASARKIAMSIANSPLVKTAIAGEDANWGRVVMAVGKAGEPADRDKLSIWFAGIRVAHKGMRDPSYDEAQVSAEMKKPEIYLKVALGMGKGRDRVLTCDLTKEYIAINGDYRVVSVKTILVAACALIDADGRVLLAQRPEGKTMAGLWEFPGGKVETGELPEQCLIRELKEELAITVREACLAPLTFASHSYPDFHLLMPLYVCRRWEGTVTALEGQELAWVKPNRLRKYDMPPADVPLISHLMSLL